MEIKIIRSKEVPTYIGPGDGYCKILVDQESTGQDKIMIGWVTFPPGKGSDEHVRDFDEILYVTKGNAQVITEDGRCFEHTEGDIIFIPKGIKHRHVSRGPGPLEQIAIFPPGVEKGIKQLPILKE
jgi:quercetin dioxygenase-like cupin family protein